MKSKLTFITIVTAVTIFSLFLGIKLIDIKKIEETKTKNIHMVDLLSNRAEPDIVSAKTGDFVQFNSMDGKEHNLSQGSGNAVDENHSHDKTGMESGVFKSDEAYKIQFKKSGIYSFHDHFNPDVYIRLVVKD